MGFKENLRKYREALGINAKDFASQIGVAYTTYANYENVGSEPKYETLIKIAAALNVSLDDLLDYRPNKLQYWIRFLAREDLDIETDKNNVLFSVYTGNEESSYIAINKDEFVKTMNDYHRFACEESKREIEDITMAHFTEYFMEKIFEDTTLNEEQKINAMYAAGRDLHCWPEIASDDKKRHMIIRFMKYLYGID